MDKESSNLSILPMNRVKMIMKSSHDGEFNHEACFVMAKAAEGFVALLLRQAFKSSDNKREVDYPDLVNAVRNNDSFSFLNDVIVPKITGKEYLEILKRVEERERMIALEDEL